MGGILATLPQNRRAPLWRDNRVGRVLKHIQLDTYANGQCTTGTTLANYRGDDGGFQARHHCQVKGDGLTLATLLGTDARIGARGIDKGQDRHLETLGHFHQAQGLAVTFRARHAEVTLDLVTHFAAFLVTDHHYGLVVQASSAANDGQVIRIDRKSTRLNSSHVRISYAVFCLKKKRKKKKISDI